MVIKQANGRLLARLEKRDNMRFIKRSIYKFFVVVFNGTFEDLMLAVILGLRLAGIVQFDYSNIFLFYLMIRIQTLIYVVSKLEIMHSGHSIEINRNQLDRMSNILEELDQISNILEERKRNK